MLLEFLLAVVSCRGETQCVGNVHNVSSTRVAEFDFLDSGCLTCAYSLWFSLKRFLYHIVSYMWYLDVNSVKTDFLILSSPFHIHSILKLAPSPLSNIGENAFGAHFLQLYRKNEYGDPHFLFHDFNKDSASFRWEKIGTNLCSVFWQFY